MPSCASVSGDQVVWLGCESRQTASEVWCLPVVCFLFFTSDNGGGICFRLRTHVHLSVCLSVCVQDYSKTRARIWMKCCVSTDVGTWTNWLTFESDPDHSPDAGTWLLSPIAYAVQRGILLRWENTTYWYWVLVEAATHGFEVSEHRCRR